MNEATDHDTAPATRGMSTGRILLSTAILIAAAAVGYVMLYGVPGSAAEATAAPTPSQESAAPATIQAPAATPVAVETASAVRDDLVMQITATGVAEATRQLEVQSQVGGTLARLPVREGQVVAEADLLAAVDNTELALKVQIQREALVRSMARYAQNQAFLAADAERSDAMRELADAQDQMVSGVMSAEQFRSIIDDARFDRLFDTITRSEVMAAQDSLLSNRANYALAELDLERAQTLAPFKGQIAALEVVVGQRLNAGAKLMTLVDSDPIRVRVAVLESEAGLVRIGRRAAVIFAAYPAETFMGSVDAINPLVDPETKTLEVIVSLANADLRLRPGMFAQITLDTQIFRDRLLVPSTAVLLRDDRPMLFTVKEGRSQWVYIRKGLENADWVEVLEGVEAGDEVVTDGHYTLAHDAAVRVVEAADTQPDRRP